LYFCDFPPLNSGGGGLLMELLLRDYPPESLTILTSPLHLKRIYGDRPRAVPSNYTLFPVFAGKGRWGIGRLRDFLDWLALPCALLLALYLIKKRGVRLILTVAHGRFFVAAACAARLSRLPLVLWVHDDWVWHPRHFRFTRPFASRVFAFALRTARHVYAVSQPMADWLKSAYGVEAELQLPCAEEIPPGEIASRSGASRDTHTFRISYAGTNIGTVDTVDILAGVVAAGPTLPDGRRIEFHLYVPGNGSGRPAWNRPNIAVHPWLSQADLRRELARADLLFLPYDFSSHAFLWARSFPTKAADYLRYGKPILLMAPEGAAIVPYARAHGFAAVLDHPDESALLELVRRIASDATYTQALSARALETFRKNHNAAQQRSEVYRLIGRLCEAPATGGGGRSSQPMPAEDALEEESVSGRGASGR
jgi:glycosyltransferase involved in cell wall biosynthesis